MDNKKTCFVIMPYGNRIHIDGATLDAIRESSESQIVLSIDAVQSIDFDAVHKNIISEAMRRLGIACVRCDHIPGAGSMHRDMFSNILRADVAIVDISTLSANVLYELGVRHALRRKVTVLIQREGTVVPFNFGGYRVISYHETRPEAAIIEIIEFVTAGLDANQSDSPIYDFIRDLQPPQFPMNLIRTTSFSNYRVDGRGDCTVGLATGELKNVKGIDVWVNSENRNMQMARFFDSSISGSIRWLGAKKSSTGKVTDDTIARELAELMDGAAEVDGGTVLPTGPGELRERNQVKWIFHAATAQGIRPFGYAPVGEIWSCVGRALELADDISTAGEPLTSVLFPLLGTGTGGIDPEQAVERLLEEILAYLILNPDSVVRRVYILTPFIEAYGVGSNVFDRCPKLKRTAR